MAFNPYLQGVPQGHGQGLLPLPAGLQPLQQPPLDNRQALLQLAQQLGQGEEDSSSDEDVQPSAMSEIQRKMSEFQALATANPALSSLPQAAMSNVMGPEYFVVNHNDAGLEYRIRDAESRMHSADRKRQVRLLMSLQALHDSVIKTMATGLGMRSFNQLTDMQAAEGAVGFASTWMASQMAVRASLDKLEEEIRREISLLNLANDKGNKHGFGILNRMNEIKVLENTVPKPDWELYLRAQSSMNQMKAARPKKSRGGGGGGGGGRGGKRSRPNAAKTPKFPQCAICGQKGHVAGDAACKAAAKN